MPDEMPDRGNALARLWLCRRSKSIYAEVVENHSRLLIVINIFDYYRDLYNGVDSYEKLMIYNNRLIFIWDDGVVYLKITFKESGER
jgi:hypothetical protein